MPETGSFFNEIKEVYGGLAHTTIKQLAQLHNKLTKLDCRRMFLLACRRTGIMPNHIQLHAHCMQDIYDNHPNFAGNADKILKKFKRSILSLEIRITFNDIAERRKQLSQGIQKLRELVPSIVVENFLNREKERQRRTKATISKSNKEKIKRLKDKTYVGVQAKGPGGANMNVENLTATPVPEEVERLLSLGKKFSIDPLRTHKPTFINMITDIEYILTQHYEDEDDRNRRRQRANNIITNLLTNHRIKKKEPNISIIASGPQKLGKKQTRN